MSNNAIGDLQVCYSELQCLLKKISFDNTEIGSMIKDFYLTDSISRLSKTMAECSQIRKELRNGKAI